jgi:hypothetical protein
MWLSAVVPSASAYGSPFRVDCGESGVLVGLTGRSGTALDSIGGLCVKVDPVVGVWVGPIYQTARYGGDGGGEFSKKCEVNQTLVGIYTSNKLFNTSYVMQPVEIECWNLGIGYEPPLVVATPPLKAPYPNPGNAPISCWYKDWVTWNTPKWALTGIALEGDSGKYVDRINLVCGGIPVDMQPWRISFQSSPNMTVLEGAPVAIAWRAGSDTPPVTANLFYVWNLVNWSRAAPIPVSTTVVNPCAYALQPCSFVGTVTSSKSVTFNNLAAGEYELQMTVAPRLVSSADSKAGFKFTIRPNLIESLTFAANSLRPGSATTATVKMEGPAPPNGYVLHLASSNPALITLPATISVPGGSDKANFSILAKPSLSDGGQATISVSTKILRVPVVSVAKSTDTRIYTRGLPDETLPEASLPPLVEEQDVPVSEEVTERGLQSIGISPKGGAGVPSSRVSESSPLANVIIQANSTANKAVVATAALSLPSETKQAVLNVLSNNVTLDKR